LLEICQRRVIQSGSDRTAAVLEIEAEYITVPFEADPLRRSVAGILSGAGKQGAGGVDIEIRGGIPGRTDYRSVSRTVVSEIRRRAMLGMAPRSVAVAVEDQDGYSHFRSTAGRPAVACLGDSITYGFPYGQKDSWVYLAGEKLGLAMINLGINGDTTGGMLWRFDRQVVPKGPSHLVIMGGINDVLMGIEAGEVLNNIREITARSLANGICPVIGITTPLVGEAMDYHDRQALSVLEELRRGIRSYASEREIPSIDFHSALLDPNGLADSRLFVDGGHPGREGYRRMARAAEAALSRVI